MAAENSTILKQSTETPISYTNFIGVQVYQLAKVKAILAGCRSLVGDVHLDAAYLLDMAIKQLEVNVLDISASEMTYELQSK